LGAAHPDPLAAALEGGGMKVVGHHVFKLGTGGAGLVLAR